MSLLSRESGKQRFGSLVIDFAAHEVLLDDEVVGLTRSEFALLAALARRPRQAISSRDLLQAMWDEDWESDATLLQIHVSRLRRKLGESAKRPRFVQTVHGVGYRFEPGPAEEASRSVVLFFDHRLILRRVTPREPFLGYHPDAIIGTVFAPSGIDASRRKAALAFAVGNTYPAADVIKFTKLPVKSSRITTVSGKACRKKGQAIRIVEPGKCTVTVRNGRQRIPVVITVY